MHVGATATVDFVGPLSIKATFMRVEIVPGTYDFIEPSSQLKRAVWPSCEVRSDIAPSVSHFLRLRELTNVSRRTSMGTANRRNLELYDRKARDEREH
jgi:hypothetical protein